MKFYGSLSVVSFILLILVFDSHPSQGITFSLDGLTAPATLVTPDDILSAGAGPPPPVPTSLFLPGASGLPPGPIPPPPPVDVDAFSYGEFRPGVHSPVGVEFSVAPGAIGSTGSALASESATGDEPADIYGSALGGSNGLIWDDDGIPSPGLGIFGPVGVPFTSNVDGWEVTAPFGFLPTGPSIHFSITAADAAGHPIYSGSGASGAYIFFSPPVVGYSVAPALYASDLALGLSPGDDIDALSIIEDGALGFTAGDSIYFSLTPGSPTLGAIGASPGDVLVTTTAGVPSVAIGATSIGLAPGDDLDALYVFTVPEPSTMAIVTFVLALCCFKKHR